MTTAVTRTDPDESRRIALWAPAIAEFRETRDPTKCFDLHERGVIRPTCLDDAFMSAVRHALNHGKRGPKEKRETLEMAKRIADAVYEGRRISRLEKIPRHLGLERAAVTSGIAYETLALAHEGSGSKKVKRELRERKKLTGPNY